MTPKLFSIRRKFTLCSAFNNSIHSFIAKSRVDALARVVNGLVINVISSMNERCPYRYKYQFVNWLVTYKGWKASDAKRLTLRQMYGIYYAS